MRKIFEHSSLEEFLESYFSVMRHSQAAWSIRLFAQQLSLPGASSLTRLLTGERTASNRICEALLKHFQFSKLEEEYFYFLVLKNRAKADPVLNSILDRGCWPVATAANQNPLTGPEKMPPLLEISDGRILSLVGQAPISKVNRILEEDDLHCVPVNHTALVYLNVCDYAQSTVGPYREFYIGFCCMPKAGSLLDFGMSFRKIICSNLTLVNLGTMVWGNDYQYGTISFSGTEAEVGLENGPGLKMAAASTNSEKVRGQSDHWGFATAHGSRRRFRLQTRFQMQEFSYNERTDRLNLEETSGHAAFLREIEFQPQKWQLRTELSCQIYPVTMS